MHTCRKVYYVALYMSQTGFELYVSEHIEQALLDQGVTALETDRLALEALASHLGLSLPDEPRILLLEPPEVPDEDVLAAPITEWGVIDDAMLTRSVAAGLVRHGHELSREAIERPAFWSGLGMWVVGPALAIATKSPEPIWAAGAGFGIATGFMLYANRARDLDLPDLSELAPPVRIIEPQPRYQAAF